jgi:hypothetical protein
MPLRGLRLASPSRQGRYGCGGYRPAIRIARTDPFPSPSFVGQRSVWPQQEGRHGHGGALGEGFWRPDDPAGQRSPDSSSLTTSGVLPGWSTEFTGSGWLERLVAYRPDNPEQANLRDASPGTPDGWEHRLVSNRIKGMATRRARQVPEAQACKLRS